MGLAKAIKDGNKPQDINIVNSTMPMDAAEAVAPLTTSLALVQGYMASVPFGVPLVQEPTHGARQLAQLISTPNYVVGAISSFSVALIADRTQQRGIITVVLTSIMILSYCLALLTLNVYGTLDSFTWARAWLSRSPEQPDS
jgi:MFS family permease